MTLGILKSEEKKEKENPKNLNCERKKESGSQILRPVPYWSIKCETKGCDSLREE